MSARDSADDLLADWLNRRDGPPVDVVMPTGFYRPGDPAPIDVRRARRRDRAPRRLPGSSRCETLREEYGMSRDDSAEDVLAERLCAMVDAVLTAVLRDDGDIVRTRNDAAGAMAAEAVAILRRP